MGKKTVECYDILNDPCETKNIIEKKYSFFEEKIENQIKNCLKEITSENFKKFTKEEIIKKCNSLNYWGQQDKSKIKLLSLDEEADNMAKTESQTNFLEAMGYDIFYEKNI